MPILALVTEYCELPDEQVVVLFQILAAEINFGYKFQTVKYAHSCFLSFFLLFLSLIFLSFCLPADFGMRCEVRLVAWSPMSCQAVGNLLATTSFVNNPLKHETKS